MQMRHFAAVIVLASIPPTRQREVLVGPEPEFVH
jgi:hypothetical protein